jgi:hypothetical protein
VYKRGDAGKDRSCRRESRMESRMTRARQSERGDSDQSTYREEREEGGKREEMSEV